MVQNHSRGIATRKPAACVASSWAIDGSAEEKSHQDQVGVWGGVVSLRANLAEQR